MAAAATTIILLLLGSSVGLTMLSPWAGNSASFTTVSVTAAIWFVVVQWLAFALGGYLAGGCRRSGLAFTRTRCSFATPRTAF